MLRRDRITKKELWEQISTLCNDLTVAEVEVQTWRNVALILAGAFDDPEQREHARRFIQDVDGGR